MKKKTPQLLPTYEVYGQVPNGPNACDFLIGEIKARGDAQASRAAKIIAGIKGMKLTAVRLVTSQPPAPVERFGALASNHHTANRMESEPIGLAIFN